MQTFSEYTYQQPDIEQLKSAFAQILEAFKQADSFHAQKKAIERIYELREEFESMRDIAKVRYTSDTTNEFYTQENAFFDEQSPIYEGLISDYYKALIASPFREELKKEYGILIFDIAEMAIKTHDKKITEQLQKENRLSTEYMQLLASAQIEFEGKERTLAEMTPFQTGVDRDLRQRASEVKWQFMAENHEKLDSIYDELVQTRTEIAHQLGYDNFVSLGYDRMSRSGYGPKEVATFRKLIQEHVVPLASKLRKEQADRLGLDSLKYYDEPLFFKDGNAKPQGDASWIIDQGQKMYTSLSSETDEFYRFMREKELMDLEVRKGKAGGGYCTYISKYASPYIFANFNGTDGDIFVLTHEAGHAFQVYRSRGQAIAEYTWPTLEACEIHSMSMEYFNWPYMDLFFGENADRYRYGHLLGSILFLPYGCAVDEFQHFIYENPKATPAQRNAQWREIEKKYLPHRDYEGNDFLEKGAFWQAQRHIYFMPFYYIDYVLAQICAFQFWIKAQENHEAAFRDYVGLCDLGGSMPFLDLVQAAGLQSPFEENTVKKVVAALESYLQAETTSWLNPV